MDNFRLIFARGGGLLFFAAYLEKDPFLAPGPKKSAPNWQKWPKRARFLAKIAKKGHFLAKKPDLEPIFAFFIALIESIAELGALGYGEGKCSIEVIYKPYL